MRSSAPSGRARSPGSRGPSSPALPGGVVAVDVVEQVPEGEVACPVEGRADRHLGHHMRGITAQLEVREALDKLDRAAVRSWSSDHTPTGGNRAMGRWAHVLRRCRLRHCQGALIAWHGRDQRQSRAQSAHDTGAQCFFLNRKFRELNRIWSFRRAISWWRPAANTSCCGSSTRSWAAPPAPEFGVDEMSKRTAALGDVHEHKVLASFLEEFGPWDPATGRGVYDVVPAETMDRATLLAKHHESMGALRSGADVVFQAAFFDGQFHGRSDFLVRRPDGSYAVFDTKLARHAKVTALLQLAAYGDQLLKAGIRAGSGGDPGPRRHGAAPRRRLRYVRSSHKLSEILPVFRERRERFLALAAAHRSQPGTVALGRSGHHRLRPLRLLPGAGPRHRRSAARGADELGAAQDAPGSRASSPSGTWRKPAFPGRTPRSGACRTRRRCRAGSAPRMAACGTGQGRRRTQHPLPRDPGKHAGGAAPAQRRRYLLRLRGRSPVAGERHRSLGTRVPVRRDRSAHRARRARRVSSRSGRTAGRRRSRPSWTSWTTSKSAGPGIRTCTSTTTPPTRKLPSGSSRSCTLPGEDTVDQWLRDGLLVDLYQTVRNSIRISENSYSIKKLEPLYMGTNLRSGDVKDAGASVVAYAQYCEARDAGRDDGGRGNPRRHLRLQRIRLPLDAGAAELAARPGPRTRDQARRRSGSRGPRPGRGFQRRRGHGIRSGRPRGRERTGAAKRMPS